MENLLGAENKGFVILMKARPCTCSRARLGRSVLCVAQELPLERLLVADQAAAAAEVAFEWTRTYCKERKAFGGKLMDMQVGGVRATECTDVLVARRDVTVSLLFRVRT